MKFATTAALAAIGLASSAGALPKISRAGRFLYDDSGNRFYIKGVAYQEQGQLDTTSSTSTDFPEPANFIDPLANPNNCNRDVPFLQQLGINAIRAYSVDPTLNHDGCMSSLSSAGIYTIIDLTQPVNGSIDRANARWTSNLLTQYLQTVDAFLKYDNVLAFTVGNEVVRMPNETIAAPFIKAAARDVKAYLKSKGSSALVTYASTDGADWRILLAQYLSCGDDSESLDLYGLNNYEWKGDATIASYSGSNQDFANYNIPAYFSEFGSNLDPPRLFTEVQALFGSDMSQIWSGGLAFSYFQSLQAGFALVNISSDDSSVIPLDDFNTLKQQYGQVSFVNSPSQSAAGQTQFPACVAPDNVNFFGSTTLPPTPNQAACDCAVDNAFSCVFTPQTPNTTAIIGSLLDFTCGQLGQLGLDSCNELSANGTTGQYGELASCDPGTQLSFAMSEYFQAQNRDPVSCSFAGNATINSGAPTSADAADAAASSCLSGATSTFTPTGPAVPAPTHSGTGSSGSGGSGNSASSLHEASMAVGAALLAAALGAFSLAL